MIRDMEPGVSLQSMSQNNTSINPFILFRATRGCNIPQHSLDNTGNVLTYNMYVQQHIKTHIHTCENFRVCPVFGLLAEILIFLSSCSYGDIRGSHVFCLPLFLFTNGCHKITQFCQYCITKSCQISLQRIYLLF